MTSFRRNITKYVNASHIPAGLAHRQPTARVLAPRIDYVAALSFSDGHGAVLPRASNAMLPVDGCLEYLADKNA